MCSVRHRFRLFVVFRVWSCLSLFVVLTSSLIHTCYFRIQSIVWRNGCHRIYTLVTTHFYFYSLHYFHAGYDISRIQTDHFRTLVGIRLTESRDTLVCYRKCSSLLTTIHASLRYSRNMSYTDVTAK